MSGAGAGRDADGLDGAAARSTRRSDTAARTAVWIERAGGAVLLAIAARIAREPLIAR